jgi:HTH-type transcriptional regulator/antitoxin HipB
MEHLSAQDIGQMIKKARKILGLRQQDIAFVSGTGIRFIVDLERGKPTCQLGKVLHVMSMLGIQLGIKLPEKPHG